jgi:hypothetical protein
LIDEVIDLEIFVVVTPGVEECLSHLDPAKVTDELYDGVVGDENDWRVVEEWAADLGYGYVDTVICFKTF